LWKTEPKSSYDATGRRLDYMQQSKESLKEQAAQAFSAASDIAGKAQDAATAKGSEVWEGAKEKMRDWQESVQESVGDVVTDTASKLKSSGESIWDDIRPRQHDLADQIGNLAKKAGDSVRDDDTRNQLLLGIAGVAIAAALGIACQKRLSDTLADNQERRPHAISRYERQRPALLCTIAKMRGRDVDRDAESVRTPEGLKSRRLRD